LGNLCGAVTATDYLTIQLQWIPNDHALRERIIKLGVEIKYALAIPEEVERRMAHGMAAIKAANNLAGCIYANRSRHLSGIQARS
jgi:hypothetical protein